jgi:hypothetical protein
MHLILIDSKRKKEGDKCSLRLYQKEIMNHWKMKCGVTINALNFLGIIFFKIEYNKLFEILSKPFLIFGKNKNLIL